MMDRKIITVVGLLSLLAISLAAYGQTGITAATNDRKRKRWSTRTAICAYPQTIAPFTSFWGVGR